jgi:hypothetical protein
LSAVLRASRELCKADIAEQKIEAGPTGGRVLFLRLKKPMNVDVSGRRGVSYTDEISTSRRSDSKMPSRRCRDDKSESPLRRNAITTGTSGDGRLH